MAEYTFKTKEEWQAAYQKLGRYEEIKAAVLEGVDSTFWKLYEKEAGADRFEDGIPKRKKNMETFLNVAANDLAVTPGITELKVLSGVKRQFKITGEKGWISAKNAVVASPKNEETKAQAQSIQQVNSTIDPQKEKELKQEYNSLAKQADRDALSVVKDNEKLSVQQEQQIKQSTDQGKSLEDQRQSQADEARQAAAQSGVALQPEPEKCPCGTKLSDQQRDAINWGRENSVFQNPVASQINNAQGGFANSLLKINSAAAILGAISGAPTDQISKLANSVGNMQGALANYSDTSNRLSGLPFSNSGPDLLSLVSTVGAAVNFQCALGVEGLDVGLGIGLMTEDGKLRLNTAINVNADLGKILDSLSKALPENSGAPGALQQAKDAVNGIQAELAKITNEINAIAGDINGAISEVNGMYTDALNFVTQFTNINFALNFSNDPCSKFGIGFQQGILNPEFVERARAANPLNTAANPGFGTSTR